MSTPAATHRMDELEPQIRADADTGSPKSPQPSVQASEEPPTKNIRTRAPKACLSCRSRKVRCDVSLRGRPCTNCHLDSGCCVVTGRASKHRQGRYDVRDGIQASWPPYGPSPGRYGNRQPIDHWEPEPMFQQAPINHQVSLASSNSHNLTHDQSATDISANSTSSLADHDQHIQPSSYENSGPFGGPLSSSQALPLETIDGLDFALSFLEPSIHPTSSQPLWNDGDGSRSGLSPEISFYCYPFLKIAKLHHLPQEDAAYLESQKCFQIPTRTFLDEFVQQYFLHVHPFLPLIDEAAFWRMYHQDSHIHAQDCMSVLVLQAMLFAASTFVSEPTMRALGYRDIRSMRAAFLRRAKSLYAIECESSPIVLAQACVLLSFTSLSSSRTPNTIWLSLAIEHARLAGADNYAVLGPHQKEKQNTFKRLWWCCIIRDCSMSLLMKLPNRITRATFDFNDRLGSKDLEHELHRSKVYSFATKEALAEVLTLSIELYCTMSDVLSLVMPAVSMQRSSSQDSETQASNRLRDCKASMEAWRASAEARLQAFRPSRDAQVSQSLHRRSAHESVILYRNIMYMYYHTTQIAMCHHEVLHLGLVSSPTGPNPSRAEDSLADDMSNIFQIKRDLQDQTSELAECHKVLMRLNLVQWLPSAAIGFVPLPLVLNILQYKLSPAAATRQDPEQATETTQGQVDTLVHFIKVYANRYDGVEWISQIIRHVVGLAQLDDSPIQQKRSSRAINWTDIFAFQPRSYLRLILALDLSLRTGQLPQDQDFPVKLRGLFTLGANPFRKLVDGPSSAVDVDNHTEADQGLEAPNSDFAQGLEDACSSYVLGLDECLITSLDSSLQNPLVLDECMDIVEAPESVSHDDEDSPSGCSAESSHAEALSTIMETHEQSTSALDYSLNCWTVPERDLDLEHDDSDVLELF